MPADKLKSTIAINFLMTGFLFFHSTAEAQKRIEIEDLRKMSFEELMEVEIDVSAAITHLVLPETPAAVTVITADDIRHTPARNILDLIEVYVPGAIWMNYEEGTQIGMRGLIANHNTKYLLRVNGKSMNNKGHFGAMSELEEWDLNDIKQIEIVRGPGSVTYGPGAIAGVINITTHNTSSSKGLKATANYVNKYGSRGLSLRHSYESPKFKLFSYASITRTPGFRPRQFLVKPDNDYGYIGETFQLGKEPLDYFADYRNDPQIKIHADAEFKGNWRIWTRYTQQGSTWSGNEAKTEFDGKLLNQQSLRIRQWTAALQNERELSGDLSLSTMLSMGSSDAERIRGGLRDPDPEHILNKQVGFSETGILLNSTANWHVTDRAEIAAGFEYSHDSYGAGWGDSEQDMKLGEDGLIVNGPESNAIRTGNKGSADRYGTELFVGDGWSTNTYSLFYEANFEILPRLTTLLSGRADKNTFTKWLYSPRVALISNLADGHYLKLIAQKSVRMNSAGQLYTENQNYVNTRTEKLKGLELIYTAYPRENLSINLSVFRNNINFIAWSFDAKASIPVGTLNLYGFEAEYKQKLPFGNVGASYSYVKQIDWNLAEGVLISGVSYADYNQALPDVPSVLEGYGNDLANWPNSALKFFGTVSLSDRITFHADSRFVWDFRGARDGFGSLRRAVEGTSYEAAVANSLRAVEDIGTYKLDFRTNLSLSYKVNNNTELQLYGLNILGANSNKRYSYDYGNDAPAPKRVRFIEEPRVWGIRLNYGF